MRDRFASAVSGIFTLAAFGCSAAIAPAQRRDGVGTAPVVGAFCSRRAQDPPRTVLERPCGTIFAVLTDGARTVVLEGPERRFEEATAAHPVLSHAYVRLLPAAFGGAVDDAMTAHLDQAARDPRPDLLALAMQYVAGAPPILESGLQIAGDADYGPLPQSGHGQRTEGADFNDYLGVPWTYADGTVDRPESRQLRSLDCSGFMRMIWGYRAGMPLGPGAMTAGSGAIPRRVVQMAKANLGVTVIAAGFPAPAAQLPKLQVGDIVFFDADPADGTDADHVGMVLGVDTGGHVRFISSRKGANGPTMGDTRGASVLDGHGLYARSLTLARRW